MGESPDWQHCIRLAVSGDRAALQFLLLQFHDRIHRFILRRLPLDVARFVDLEDVVQDTFTAACREIGNLRADSPEAFIAWLLAIARSQLTIARTHYRALKRGGGRPGISLSQDDSDTPIITILNYLARNTKSPRSIAGDAEYIQLIRDAFADLDPDHQAVLRLRILDSLDHGQIAQRLGRTPEAVRQLYLRSLRYLRALLPGSGESSA